MNKTPKPKLDLMRGGRVEPANNVPNSYDTSAQENDGGVTVALMNTNHVRLTDRDAQYAIDMPMFLAMDVGRRIIDMATEAIRQHLIEVEKKNATGVVPAIQVVHGKLPKT